ncbi:SPOR domain-containing protein [Gemmatimonas sp.]|uniref:SPOR domain-containing protein n=1 Tax=Gemmatimonas sp. TaxID=1962908 RepID=UPI00286DDC75|nr:SPOR domain-containing protein [Gemmatimonas sp.]
MTPLSLTESWEMEGRRLAPLLDGICSVVIAATDASLATSMALGVARAQGLRRRVAVADLIGEAPAIEALLTGDDPHGISDSFLYGVSLNKIARPMAGAENVFLMPSGTEAVAHDAVYANERWRRLAAGFHQVGALLVVVANPATPGFADLCAYVGALMPVGDTVFPTPQGVPLIAPPAPPKPEPLPPTPRPNAARARAAAAEDESSRRRRFIAIVSVLGAIAVALGAFWPQLMARLPEPVAELITGKQREPDSTAVVVPPTPMDTSVRSDSAKRDSLLRDSTGTIIPTPDSLRTASPPMTVENAADSASASRFAVYFATANTRAAAMPDARVRALDAVALSPVAEGNEQWFRVTIGASSTRAQAESLLTKLRTQKIVGSGSIVSVPYALRLARSVTPTLIPTRLAELANRGIIAYALLQPDGSATVYTGAFESPMQATPLADSLRALRVAPVLVYRTGRAF